MNLPSLSPQKKINLFKFLLQNLLVIIFLFGLTTGVFAQVLPKENGKITFTEKVKVDSADRDKISQRAIIWLSQHAKGDPAQNGLQKFLVGENHFFVYIKGMVSKEIHGTIRYRVTVTPENGVYTYIFSDFVFEYYKINRNYKYVATGQEKPLEEEKFPGYGTAWIKHKKTTYTFIQKEIASLKLAMRG